MYFLKGSTHNKKVGIIWIWDGASIRFRIHSEFSTSVLNSEWISNGHNLAPFPLAQITNMLWLQLLSTRRDFCGMVSFPQSLWIIGECMLHSRSCWGSSLMKNKLSSGVRFISAHVADSSQLTNLIKRCSYGQMEEEIVFMHVAVNHKKTKQNCHKANMEDAEAIEKKFKRWWRKIMMYAYIHFTCDNWSKLRNDNVH